MKRVEKRGIVVGFNGASGAIGGIRLLEASRGHHVEVRLVMTKRAERKIVEETDKSTTYVPGLADIADNVLNIGACVASGSFTDGMLVAPCSIRTASAIEYCVAGNLRGA